MPETISQQDLERYFWGAAVLLRGYIDASDYKQFIFPLLYFKRVCDVFDEESAEVTQEYGPGVGEDFAEYHRFTSRLRQLFSHAFWGMNEHLDQFRFAFKTALQRLDQIREV